MTYIMKKRLVCGENFPGKCFWLPYSYYFFWVTRCIDLVNGFLNIHQIGWNNRSLKFIARSGKWWNAFGDTLRRRKRLSSRKSRRIFASITKDCTKKWWLFEINVFEKKVRRWFSFLSCCAHNVLFMLAQSKIILRLSKMQGEMFFGGTKFYGFCHKLKWIYCFLVR